jgi:transportin-1
MRMFPMLECLTSVLAAIGLEAQQYVLHIYTRCYRLCETVISSHQRAQGNPHSPSDEAGDDLPNKDFAICGLDVISAQCEGLGELFATLVNDAGSKEGLFQLIFAALQDPLPELRQSGFSLAGEICKHAIALVSPAVAAQLLQACVLSLDTDYPLVCNNAAWAAGELALQVGGEFLQPYIAQLMHALITGMFASCNVVAMCGISLFLAR